MSKSSIYNSLIIFALIGGYFEPTCVADLARLQGGIWTPIELLFRYWNYLEMLAVIVLIVNALIKSRNIKRPFTAIIALIQLIVIIACIRNKNLDNLGVIIAIRMITLAWLFEDAMIKGTQKPVFHVIKIWLGLLIAINILTVLFYPNGFYIDNRGWDANYFLGQKNTHIYFYLPFLTVLFGDDLLRHHEIKKSKLIVLLFAFCAISFIADSSTSLVSFLVMFTIAIVFSRREIPVFLHPRLVFIYTIVLSGLWMFSGISGLSERLLGTFFSGNTTLARRTLIWAESLVELLPSNYILGLGRGEIMMNWGWIVAQCHNKYLDIIYVGGIPLAIAFGMLIYYSTKKLTVDSKNLYSIILSIMMTGYAVLYISEASRSDPLFVIVFCTAFYITRFPLYENRFKKLKVRLRKQKIR